MNKDSQRFAVLKALPSSMTTADGNALHYKYLGTKSIAAENQALDNIINSLLKEGINSEISSSTAMQKEVEDNIQENINTPLEQGNLTLAYNYNKDIKEAKL